MRQLPPEPALTRCDSAEPVSHVRQGAPGSAYPEVRPNSILRVDGVAELVSVCFKRRLPLCAFFCLSLSANDAAAVASLSPTE
jgi:hypothetical protein